MSHLRRHNSCTRVPLLEVAGLWVWWRMRGGCRFFLNALSLLWMLFTALLKWGLKTDGRFFFFPPRLIFALWKFTQPVEQSGEIQSSVFVQKGPSYYNQSSLNLGLLFAPLELYECFLYSSVYLNLRCPFSPQKMERGDRKKIVGTYSLARLMDDAHELDILLWMAMV